MCANKLKEKLIDQLKSVMISKVLDVFDKKNTFSRDEIKENVCKLPFMDLGQMDLISSNVVNWDSEQLEEYPEICIALKEQSTSHKIGELFWDNLDNHYQIDDDDIGAEELDRIFKDVCQDLKNA